MRRMIDKVCSTLCDILSGGDSLISRTFHIKSLEIRECLLSYDESMKRLEILTEEMSVESIEIRSHEKLLTIAANNLDSPIWGKDIDSNFIFMNDSCAKKICKTSVEDALKIPDADYVMSPIERVCRDSDQLVHDTMKTHRFFEHARFDDGTDIFLDTTKSPWLVDSELIGTVGIGQCITEYISKEIRDKYFKSGYVEIAVDLLYNSDDIPKLLEGNL